MANIIEEACKGNITSEMEEIAKNENLNAEYIREMIAQGKIIVPLNTNRKSTMVGIGKGLATKINASIGTSSDIVDIEAEVKKARVAEECGADTLMELSVGGDLDLIRREVLAAVKLPVGNVPLYQAFCEAAKKYKNPNKLSEEMLFDLIEKQCADGISFMAIHCGINLYTIENKENPLYEKFDRVASILKKYDVVLSLGNGLRAGAIHDSFDRAQVQELILNCELAEIGRKMGCQMMVEGPGHVPLDEIEANIILQKRMSNEAPYYMLGPLATDVTPGYDHISSAIGAASSARYGADLICYITPAEHLALPNEEDVRMGVKAAKIAVYIGDMNKYKDSRRERDKEMSKARRDSNWDKQFKWALFEEDAREIRKSREPQDKRTCTMCGEFCANEGSSRLFKDDLVPGEKL